MLSVDKLRNIVEAALFASSTPLSREQIAALFDDDDRPSSATLRSVISELQQSYSDRGVELAKVASGYRFQVPDAYAPWVSRLWEERAPRYSRALLETLALIAYRQPITRAEIEQVRGVAVSSNIIRTLEERGWIRVLGHREVPGRPALFGTTRSFLDYFNLDSLNQLPTLAEIRDLDQIASELEKQLGTSLPPVSTDGAPDQANDSATQDINPITAGAGEPANDSEPASPPQPDLDADADLGCDAIPAVNTGAESTSGSIPGADLIPGTDSEPASYAATKPAPDVDADSGSGSDAESEPSPTQRPPID